MRVISIEREKCTGCGICQVVCSIAKTGMAQPSLGRIQIHEDKYSLIQMLVICQHCAEPSCQTACLMEAITRDPISGKMVRDLGKCFGCAACTVSCPISAPIADDEQEVIVTCDLCGGDPVCCKVCPQGAITYSELSHISSEKRTRQGIRFFAGSQEEVE